MSFARLRLHSEPYAMSGNIGENLSRLLGAPNLDPLQTLIREALQNIADAALPEVGPEILVRLRTLTPNQRDVLREHVLSELPPNSHSRRRFAFLKKKSNPPKVLEICDFNTEGLSGPTRADLIPVEAESTNFIDFIRNVGTPRDTPHGGGTYGFGKVALFRASKCSTLVVDSLVAGGGRKSRRLIASHLGPAFPVKKGRMKQQFTGRHWWGHPVKKDNFVDPLTDTAAKRLAGALGLPHRPRGRSGTSIMMLDFDLQGDHPETVGFRIVETVLWNFWPRMMADTPSSRRFRLRVELEGESLDVPSPEEFPPLNLFCEAMRDARTGTGHDVREIRCGRPIKLLGKLATKRGLHVPRKSPAGEASLLPAVCQHIALMRPVELVVKYLEGSALPKQDVEWAGVFLASEENEVERAFADAEPPAHDDWIPAYLPKGSRRTFVNVALRELANKAYEMGAQRVEPLTQESGGPPLARLAGRLGTLLQGAIGDGAEKSRPRDGHRRAKPRVASVSNPEFVRLEHDGLGKLAIFQVEVSQDNRKSGVRLHTTATVAMDGTPSRGSEVYEFVDRPIVVGIRGTQPHLSSDGASISLNGEEGRFEILVRMPTDAAVTVQATLERTGPA